VISLDFASVAVRLRTKGFSTAQMLTTRSGSRPALRLWGRRRVLPISER
jgi:hypothetical protein